MTLVKALLFTAISAGIAMPAGAQTSPPDTVAGRQFAAWMKVFDAGNNQAITAFLQSNFADGAKNAERLIGLRNQTGGFDLMKVTESTGTILKGLIKERDSDRYASFQFIVDGVAPNKVLNFRAELVPPPEGMAASTPRMAESAAITALKSKLVEWAAADQFAGTVLVAKNGTPVFQQSYGLADREKRVPNKLDTVFRLGSMNKMFTAVAILQLAQAGKLRVSDLVGKHLTDYPNAEIANRVTIHNLLTHSGGTGDFFGPEFESHRTQLKEIKDYIALFGKRAPEFAAGSRFEYSNYGYLLLGAIVEKVSGQSYYDYVREHIFKPAGMTRTDSLPESQPVADRSTGYTRFNTDHKVKPNTDTLPYRGTSAGGGYSTVGDLVRFATALNANKLLDPEHTTQLTTGKMDAGPAKYAYGFFESTANGDHWFGHGGGAPGMNGELRIYPDSGYVIAVLANLDPPSATKVADFIAPRLPAN